LQAAFGAITTDDANLVSFNASPDERVEVVAADVLYL
jgi:hypothetical protein